MRNNNERYRAYLLAQLANAVEQTTESAAKEKKALADVLSFQKPAHFREGDNIIVQMEKSHQKLTFAMAESGCPNPDDLTVYQFFGWQEALEEKYKPIDPVPHAPKRQ